MSMKIPQSIQLSVDDGEKIELKEIQGELNESRGRNDELEAQLSIYRQRLRRVENNKSTIGGLDSDTTTWLTIGKMFVRYSRQEVETEIEKELKLYQKKVSDLETAHKRVLDNLNRRQKRFDTFVERHRYDPSKNKKKDETNQSNEPSTSGD
eukprot:CAMPEP_0201582822 /NCGR_PEP_ID=MMETSP0190_2-20130828/91019_1 /ASSEMBLY_ACC=CAM_ASM_000263 /TAXON_ID=37353 /ORGANISM="Rosalina sp." /LENGTH=151 /DNA_ID=CAMNT_0048023541 /DNA_START=28 /DNA_END=483 /DNA_ORIENTATION=-